MLALFAADGDPLFTTGSDAEVLVVRPTELLDGAMPSANAVAAGALLRLGALTGEDELVAAGEALLAALVPVAVVHPLAVAHAIATCGLAGGGITEVVVAGRPTRSRRGRPPALRTDRSCWPGASARSHRCGRDATTDRPTYAGTTRAAHRPTPAEVLEAQLDGEREAERARHARSLDHARHRAGTAR